MKPERWGSPLVQEKYRREKACDKRSYNNNNNNNNNNRNTAHVEYENKGGATGTISKSFRKYVSNIPGKHEVKELQKTAILGTAHTLRKVLM